LTVPRAAYTEPEPPETPGLEVSVYSDGPDNGFGFWARGDHDAAQTAVVHTGATAISFDPSGWNHLDFYRSGLQTSFSGLELWVHGGPSGGQNVIIYVFSRSAGVAAISLARSSRRVLRAAREVAGR
jgi:hypothetical protein